MKRLRFTPTCVGNTRLHRHRGCRDPGSPPRAWGIRTMTPIIRHHARFTPTCVGNTNQRPAQWCRIPVHPHVRGEYVTLDANSSGVVGSPPRAWGIRACAVEIAAMIRFTPTCVGNTCSHPSVTPL